MSKQSEAKQAQCYVEKAIPMVCGNCSHFSSVMKNESGFYGCYVTEKEKRCSIGGFAVKKMGTCNKHTPKAEA